MASPRFALRWTLIGILCASLLVGLAVLVATMRPPAPARRALSFDDLAAAAEMPLDTSGRGTQIISNTTLVLSLQPYPVSANVTSTLTLIAIEPGGQPARQANPTLYIAQVGRPAEAEYAFSPQADGSYAVDFRYPAAGQYRVRVDVYVGDSTPASMLLSVSAH